MTSQSDFNFSPEQINLLKDDIKAFFLDDLEVEIGDLKVELILQFLNHKIGRNYYNLGVTDAMREIKNRADDLILLIKE